MDSLCTQCGDPFKPREEKIQCDICQQWTHRRNKCKSGISQAEYRYAKANDMLLPYTCRVCISMMPPGPLPQEPDYVPDLLDSDDEEDMPVPQPRVLAENSSD